MSAQTETDGLTTRQIAWPETREERDAYVVASHARIGYIPRGGSRRSYYRFNDLQRTQIVLAGRYETVWTFTTPTSPSGDCVLHVVSQDADLQVKTWDENWYGDGINLKYHTPEKFNREGA